jgi:hypothetical protein
MEMDACSLSFQPDHVISLNFLTIEIWWFDEEESILSWKCVESMSLYVDAAKALSNSDKKGGSLRSRIYNGREWNHPAPQIYALVSETMKWSPVLKDVIEKSHLLNIEKKVLTRKGRSAFLTLVAQSRFSQSTGA